MEAVLKSQVIERAWNDPEFKQLLLSNPKAAINKVLGITLPEHLTMRTVEESSDEIFFVLPPNPAKVVKTEVVPQGVW